MPTENVGRLPWKASFVTNSQNTDTINEKFGNFTLWKPKAQGQSYKPIKRQTKNGERGKIGNPYHKERVTLSSRNEWKQNQQTDMKKVGKIHQ